MDAIISYIKLLTAPQSKFLPSYWLSNIILTLTEKKYILFAKDFLFFNSIGFLLFAFVLFIGKKLYFRTFNFISESEKHISKRNIIDFTVEHLPLNLSLKALLKKDLKIFFRTTAQWSQLFLIFSLGQGQPPTLLCA